jgi:hypothetical protein
MRRTPRTLANAREKLVQLEQEFTRLLTRIEAMRDSVADSLVRLDGHCRDGQFCSDPGSDGTTNVIALIDAIPALMCQRA